jgi:hypothetical protein
MFKKIAFAAPLAVLAFGSSLAFAADEARHSISLIANVPTDDFYAVPVDPNLTNRDQDMSYDPAVGTLRPVDNHFFDVLHTAGAVSAKLEAPAQLISGNTVVPLKVELNGKVLTTTAQEVVGDTESNTRYRAPFKISAPAGKPVAGDYTGQVLLMIEPT